MFQETLVLSFKAVSYENIQERLIQNRGIQGLCNIDVQRFRRPMENCLPILCESVKVLVAQLCLTLYDPKNCSHLPPLSMEFFRQKYWSGLSFPTPGYLPNTWVKHGLHCRRFLYCLSNQGSPQNIISMLRKDIFFFEKQGYHFLSPLL